MFNNKITGPLYTFSPNKGTSYAGLDMRGCTNHTSLSLNQQHKPKQANLSVSQEKIDLYISVVIK